MPLIGRNIFLGRNFIGQSYLGKDMIEVSPYEVVIPSVVTSGLVLYLDSTNTNSYPGSGTSWFNLVAGQPITASLVNGVTFKDNYLQTNGTDQYITVPFNSLDYRSSNSTVMCITRYADTSGNGRMLSSVNTTTSNWLLGHYNNTTENYYANGTIQLNNGPNDTSWRVYAGTADIAGDKWSLYVNGVANTLDSTGGATGPYGFAVGCNYNPPATSEFSSGSVAVVMLYNRLLSGTEILQNYNALRSKVGL
jgi:hypothetical protein